MGLKTMVMVFCAQGAVQAPALRMAPALVPKTDAWQRPIVAWGQPRPRISWLVAGGRILCYQRYRRT